MLDLIFSYDYQGNDKQEKRIIHLRWLSYHGPALGQATIYYCYYRRNVFNVYIIENIIIYPAQQINDNYLYYGENSPIE